MINKFCFFMGAICFLLGIGGLGGACEGQGSFLVSAIVFVIGLTLSLINLVKGTECE